MCVVYTERLGQRKARFKPSVCQGSRNEDDELEDEDDEQEVLQCHRTKGRCDLHTVSCSSEIKRKLNCSTGIFFSFFLKR